MVDIATCRSISITVLDKFKAFPSIFRANDDLTDMIRVPDSCTVGDVSLDY